MFLSVAIHWDLLKLFFSYLTIQDYPNGWIFLKDTKKMM